MNEEYFDLEEFESGRPWLDREGVAWTFESIDTHPCYPLKARSEGGDLGEFTKHGKAYLHHFSWDDLIRPAPLADEPEPEQNDPVNHPAHYTQGEIECIDAIRAALTPEEFRGYCKGAALKYIWRERLKGGDESLRKAVWYLNKALEEK